MTKKNKTKNIDKKEIKKENKTKKGENKRKEKIQICCNTK